MHRFTARFIFLTVLLLALVCIAEPALAQCAMCRATGESSLRAGGGDPKGLNAGILYMFALPYLIVGSIGYWWWRNRKNDSVSAAQEDIA